MQEIEKYKKAHPRQIIVNGVVPTLKYYMRLISSPQDIIDEYTK
jgi:DNA (cytosine-5)-methyltransferase 1